MAENFNRVFAESGGKTAINDVEYADGWDFIGDNPPEVEDFNSVMNEQDKKLKELKDESGGVGINGQLWINETSSRAISVSYGNPTDNAIMVSIIMSGVVAAQTADFAVDGLVIDRFSLFGGTGGLRSSLQAIVPSGSTYKLQNVTGTTIESWRELKK